MLLLGSEETKEHPPSISGEGGKTLCPSNSINNGDLYKIVKEVRYLTTKIIKYFPTVLFLNTDESRK